MFLGMVSPWPGSQQERVELVVRLEALEKMSNSDLRMGHVTYLLHVVESIA